MAEYPTDIEILREAGSAPEAVLAQRFEHHRLRLERMVRRRMDRRLRTRVDAADVLQETYLEAARRLEDYLRDPDMPFFLWLRFLAVQRVVTLHRRHLGAKMRDVRRQVPQAAPPPGVTSVALADELLGRLTTPSAGALRAEARATVEQALEAMSPIDRDVLVLRHFEDLTNAEAAAELGIEPSSASKRYLRALERLGQVLRRVGAEIP